LQWSRVTAFVTRALLFALAVTLGAARGAGAAPALVPRPVLMHAIACGSGFSLRTPLRFPENVDAGGFDLVRERWTALGIPAPVVVKHGANVRVRVGAPPLGTDEDDVTVDRHAVSVAGGNAEAAFDALATLAQLPEADADGGGWHLGCVRIVDRPALRWRIVSDDISRGPFPTMAYFKARIRGLAAFKINGYSPYMEQVFADPAHPYVAFPERLTAAELRELAQYARRFHVALIPEQQTFAHMHESLKYEQLAPLGELPHGYLLAESDPATYAYLAPLIHAELAAVAPVPFFHIGVDEPLDLGRGRTPRTAQTIADHVTRVAAMLGANGPAPMIWDDAVQADPSILPLLPPRTVVVAFHYGAEPSFAKYIATIANAGHDLMVSPGANNWNQIYCDLTTAYANEAQFLADAKAGGPHVLGMVETVWHDDAQSLYEATWAPVAFAAASAWDALPVDRATWHQTFASAFFGPQDAARYARDLDALEAMEDALRSPPDSDPPDYLFWADPFDARIQARMQHVDLAGLRLKAEAVMTDLAAAQPPLHAQAARVMRLAALRYDVLGRRYQIGREAREYYDDARAHVAAHDDGIVYRGLNVAKYLCWELRDEMTALAPLYAAAWNAESRPAGLARVLVRYQRAAQIADGEADALDAAAREDYLRGGTLPAFDEAIGLTR
jgi:hypothetical protein